MSVKNLIDEPAIVGAGILANIVGVLGGFPLACRFAAVLIMMILMLAWTHISGSWRLMPGQPRSGTRKHRDEDPP